MGGYGLLGLDTPLLRIELLLLVQGLSIGMVIGPVTAALISNLPLEQAGAGSAVTNTVRQTGSVIGIAVGGTIMSIVYRRAVEPSLRVHPLRSRHARRSGLYRGHRAPGSGGATDHPALRHRNDDGSGTGAGPRGGPHPRASRRRVTGGQPDGESKECLMPKANAPLPALLPVARDCMAPSRPDAAEA